MNEGVNEENIKFVGNIMIDTLEAQRSKSQKLYIKDIIEDNLLKDQAIDLHNFDNNGGFALMTMHRPSNVDHEGILTPIIRFILDEVTRDMPLIWPIHPRTEKQLKIFGLW